MNRSIRRNYSFDRNEVREILLWWMKQKDLPRPIYIDDTDTTSWSASKDGGIKVDWVDDDQVELQVP